MSDAIQIHKLMSQGTNKSIHYAGRDWLWLPDLNGSSVSSASQIQYDSSATSTSGQQVIWSEAFLYWPYTITMTNVFQNTAAACLLKSGFWNLVHSLQISINNKTCNNPCVFNNIYQSMKRLMSWNTDKMTYSGILYGFTKDTATANVYSVPVGATGTNTLVLNNCISSTSNATITATGAYSSLVNNFNSGLLQRAVHQCYQQSSPVQYLSAGSGTVTSTAVLAVGDVTAVQRPQSTFSGTTQTVSGVAIIPLKYLSNLFEQLDYCQANLRLYLQINVNNGSITVNSGLTETNRYGQSTVNQFPFLTCPVIVTDAGLKNVQSNGSSTSLVTLSLGTYAGSAQQTRLYYPTVMLDPELEARLKFPLRKTLTYRDIQYFALANQGAGQAINWNITQNIPGLKRIWFYFGIAAQTLTGNAGGQPSFASPVSSAPTCPDPELQLSNISLQLNNRYRLAAF